MKIVILVGGLGTRISEESKYRPKPMVEIGGMPIIWHIMKAYSHYGFNDFIICAGYKQHMVKPIKKSQEKKKNIFLNNRYNYCIQKVHQCFGGFSFFRKFNYASLYTSFTLA